jgi:hypothetical protein
VESDFDTPDAYAENPVAVNSLKESSFYSSDASNDEKWTAGIEDDILKMHLTNRTPMVTPNLSVTTSLCLSPDGARHVHTQAVLCNTALYSTRLTKTRKLMFP